MQLPDSDQIIMLAGSHPIRAKKVRYFADPRLAQRVEPPATPEASPEQEDKGEWNATPRASAPTSRPANAFEQSEEEVGSDGGVRREPELAAHEDIAPGSAEVVNEFEFTDRRADEQAARNRQIIRQVTVNARQASLNPHDGIDL